MKSGGTGAVCPPEPLHDLEGASRSRERSLMSKPRTIWVPRIRMQRPSSSDALAAFMVSLDHGLHQVGPRVEILFSILEFQTGQKRSVMAMFMAFLLCLYVAVGKRAPLACNIVVYLVAAYCSFHNIENSSKRDDGRWIVFWMIFGLFNIFDYFTSEIREFFRIFWLLKLLFLMWCLAPVKNNGVVTIYLHFLYPAFLSTDDSVDFYGCRAACNQLFSSCYAWSGQEPPRGPVARKAKDSGEPARKASVTRQPGRNAAKAKRSSGVRTKPAGDGTSKRPSISSSAPADASSRRSSRRLSAAAKHASDSLFKSHTGTKDGNEHTYVSHLSQLLDHAPKEPLSRRQSKSEAAASSWNDVTFLSRGASQYDDARRSSSTGHVVMGKDSFIQPVIQPLFSMYSSPAGSSYPASGSTHPSMAPYAFGPSYPSYHTRPFYPGCLSQPPFNYSRPRSFLYSGPAQRHTSFSVGRRPSGEHSELDSFSSKRKDDEETQKGARDTKEGRKASGEDKGKDKKEGQEKGREGKGKHKKGE